MKYELECEGWENARIFSTLEEALAFFKVRTSTGRTEDGTIEIFADDGEYAGQYLGSITETDGESEGTALRYATIDSRIDGTGDEFTAEYPTEAEAVAHAERDWGYLTESERAVRTICAVVSRATDDGEFDWGAYDVVKEFSK